MIVDCEIDDPNLETLQAALILAHFSWNNEVHSGSIKADYYQAELKKLEQSNPFFWRQVIRHNSQELSGVLKKRKKGFYPNDKRLSKNCWIDLLGTISLEEDHDGNPFHLGRLDISKL